MPPKRKSKCVGKGKGRAKQKTMTLPSPTIQEESTRPVSPVTENDGQRSENAGDVEHDEVNTPSPSNSQIEDPNNPSSGVSKKLKKSCRLKDEEEEGQVLEWIEEHPCLWNLKHKDYKNKNIKNRLWEEKAAELGYDADSLKVWYTDLRDRNTKLHSQRSGDGQRDLTDRERWVMDRFMFLRSTIRHRRVPVKSVHEALAVARGDLNEAERIAAEDRLAIVDADDDNPDGSSAKPKKQKTDANIDDPILMEMRRKVEDAKAELTSVRTAMATEPATERTAFLDWVRVVCKNTSEENFTEFQTSFIQMQSKWKQQQRITQVSPCPSSTCSSEQSTSRAFGTFQPNSSQWRIPLSNPQNTTSWQNQSYDYMQYAQPPFLSSTNTAGTSHAISAALYDLDDSTQNP